MNITNKILIVINIFFLLYYSFQLLVFTDEFALANLAAHHDLIATAREQAQTMLARNRTQDINLLLSLFERDSAVKFLAAG